MKQTPALQQNLFNAPITEAETRLPQNILTEPLKSLVQALLTDLIAAQRPHGVSYQSERMRRNHEQD